MRAMMCVLLLSRSSGPSGSTVREIVRMSGADINSWTEATGSHRGGRRQARVFLIKVGLASQTGGGWVGGRWVRGCCRGVLLLASSVPD
jgi:hypothetical protein